MQLETFYAEESRLSTRRDWLITDAVSGRRLGAATSTWVTINTSSRKLAKIPEEVRSKFLTVSPQPVRLVLPPGQCKRKLPDMDAGAMGLYKGPLQVSWGPERHPGIMCDTRMCSGCLFAFGSQRAMQHPLV